MMKRRYTIELLISFLLITAKAFSYDFKVDGLCYNKLTDNTVELTWEALKTPYKGDIVIPSYVNYNGVRYDVVALGKSAMVDGYSLDNNGDISGRQSNRQLHSVSLPSSIISIGEHAFELCNALTSITIPNSVTSIGNYAFAFCRGLTSITMPNSITSIGECAFLDCSGLISITIPNSVTSIEVGTFRSCSGLTSITIPQCVTSIQRYAFEGCSSLASITIPSSLTDLGIYALHGTAWYNNQPDGIIYVGKIAYTFKGTMPDNSKIAIKDGTLALSNSIFEGCTGLASITLPNSLTTIGENAFRGCNALTSITIPNSVTSIYKQAFSDCGLTSITIPTSVTNIGVYAFSDCGGLTSIKVDNGNKKYDSRNSCNAIVETSSNTLMVGCKNTTIPNSVTNIGWRAFSGCSGLTSITIPSSVTSIGGYAFCDCSSLASISIPSSVKTIDDYAFDGCSGLTSVTMHSNPESIGFYAFNNCSNIREVTFDCEKARAWPFDGGSSIEKVTMTEKVKTIDDGAFIKCSRLASVTIPNSVTSIGEYAFYRCSGLTSIISEIIKPFEIREDVFPDYSKPILTVPRGTKSAYQSTASWNKFTKIVEKEADNIIQGDANGDREVNVSDIVEVVNFIMNNASSIFLKANADLNGDGEVNVTDIVMMVNVIMSGQYSAARIKGGLVVDPTDGDYLTLTEGEEGMLALNLENRGCYVASQFDLRLSNGQTLEGITLNNDRLKEHKIIYRKIDDNCYKVIVYSLSNKSIMGESGKLLGIYVAGSGEIYIDNILFVTKSCKEKHFGPLNSMTTGIMNVISAEKENIYGIDGRHVRIKASSTNGMAKGVYIINGKKHIVK